MPIDSRERSKTEKGGPKRKRQSEKELKLEEHSTQKEKLFAYFCVLLNVPIPSS